MGGGGGPRDVKSALWLADYVGSMMSEGASGTFYFHYMPTPGGRGQFLALDKDFRVTNYPPQYLAAAGDHQGVGSSRWMRRTGYFARRAT